MAGRNSARGWAVAVLLTIAADAAAQEAVEPTPEEIEAAREQLRRGLGATEYPPAAYEADPVPDWAIPDHEPLVLEEDGTALPADGASPPAVATPPAQEDPPSTDDDESEGETATVPEPAAPAKVEKPAGQKAAPSRPRSAKPAPKAKPRPPQVKSGRAAAGAHERKRAKPGKAAPKKPRAPGIDLPESLRP